MPSVLKIVVMWRSIARLDRYMRCGDGVIGRAGGHLGEDLAVAVTERVQRVIAPVAAEHHGDDLGVEHGAARGDQADGIGEAGGIDEAVLE